MYLHIGCFSCPYCGNMVKYYIKLFMLLIFFQYKHLLFAPIVGPQRIYDSLFQV